MNSELRRLSKEEIYSTLWLNDDAINSTNLKKSMVRNQAKYSYLNKHLTKNLSKQISSDSSEDENYKRLHQFDKYLSPSVDLRNKLKQARASMNFSVSISKDQDNACSSP